MYKSTSEGLDHIDRVGSFSTREHPSGRIDAVPYWAEKPEEYFNNAKDQWDSLARQLTSLREEFTKAKASGEGEEHLGAFSTLMIELEESAAAHYREVKAIRAIQRELPEFVYSQSIIELETQRRLSVHARLAVPPDLAEVKRLSRNASKLLARKQRAEARKQALVTRVANAIASALGMEPETIENQRDLLMKAASAAIAEKQKQS